MRVELAQFRELEAFAQFASDLDAETKRRIEKGSRLVEVLKQDQSKPLGFERQVTVIYAANIGLFDTVPLEKTRHAAEELLEYLDGQQGGILAEIRTSKMLSEDTEGKLKAAFEIFKTAYPTLFGKA